jgi:predicted MFS family arabinose efflux permease
MTRGDSSSSLSTPSLLGAVEDVFRSINTVFSSPEARLIFLAAALRYAAGFSIGIWKAPFIFEKFPGDETLFAGSNAIVVGVGGLLSAVVGGYLSDRLANPPVPGDKPIARAWIPAVGSLLAAPAWYLFVRASSPELSVAFLFAEYLFAECWFGPTLAALYAVVPKESRGTAQGVFSILTAAGNIGPILVGALVGGSLAKFDIGDVLVWAVCGPYVVSSILFAQVALLEENRVKSTDNL